jgi:hypothetical protein
MATLIRKRFARFGCLLALMLGTFVSAASAETLMMPDREAVKGTQTVVWGVTTQPNGTPYTIDFGDGSTPQSGTVADRSYIAFNYTYLLAGSPQVTATLTVGAEVATVKIQTWDPADPLVAAQLRNININMAIQDGLRYLWVAQSDRVNQFPANAMTHWDGSNPNSWTALVTLAFENQGYGIPNDNSIPTGLYQKYIVQRGLNFVINSLGKITSTPTVFQMDLPYAQYGYPYNTCFADWECTQHPAVASGTQPAGDPRVGVPNDANLGVLLFGESIDRSAYGTSVAMLPIAASGAMNRTVSGIPGDGSGGFVVGRTYREVLQRLSNALVWGQIDSGSGQGGWMYALNPGDSGTVVASTSGGYASDGSTVGWAVLALLDAEAAGITVPAFAKSQFQTAFNNGINSDGSFDYNTDQNVTSSGASPSYRNITRAGVGLEGLYYTGVKGGAAFASNAPGQAALTFMADRWGGANLGDYTDTCAGQGAGQNKGCAYAMFNIFKGLKLQGVTTLPGAVFRPADATHPANDWYADYQDWLVSNQTSATDKNGGYWGSMRFSCCANDTAPNSALAELVLAPVALVLPDAAKFSTVGLSPATGTSPTGLTHTLTAHAESSGTPGTPVAGAHVVFKALSGPNTGILGSADTDSNGDASITYRDLGPGTDSIRAFIGSTLASNTVTMTWTATTVTPVIVANSKVYDGTNAAALISCTVSGAVASPPGDPVSCSGVATFSDKNVANGKTVTATGITLSGVGAANYVLSTTTATTAANITPKAASVVPNAYVKEYGQGDPVFAASLNGFIAADGVTATIARTAGETVAASPYTLTATLSPVAALSNYSINYNTNLLFITRKAAAVSIAPATKVYGSADPVLTGSLAGFLPADGVTATYTRALGETVLGGPYPISAVLGPPAVLDNYSVLTFGASLTITAKPASVTPNAASKTYGSADPALGGTLTGFLGTDGVVATYARTTGETVAGNPYTISATLAPVSVLSNYAVTYNTAPFTINRRNASVTPNAASKTYGSLDPALGGTLTGFLGADAIVATYSRTTGETVAGSPYTISATLGPLTGVLNNYTVTFNTAPFTINPKPASVTPNAASKTYGAADPTLTGTLSGFLPADGVTASYSRTTGETVLGGPYVINATLGPAAVLGNYLITQNTAPFTINPLAASVTPGAASKTYGAADPTLTGTLSGFLPADGVTASYSRSGGETVAGSPYTISAVLSPAAVLTNYAITYNTAAFTINPAAVTVTADAKSKTYGDGDPALTYQVTAGALVSGDSFTGALSRTAGENVGGYAINQNTLALSANYALTYVGANLTISTRLVTVTADAKSKTYGDGDSALTYQVTSGTLVSGDSFTGALSRTAGENVGGYAINQNTLALSANYALTYVGASLTINARPVTVTADAKSKTYGDGDPALTYAISSGTLAFGDAFAGALSRTAGENVGSYAINQNTLALSANYALTYVGTSLTINARPVTATADAKSKTYGDADPALTYQVTSGNLVAGDAFTGAVARAAGEDVGAHAIAQGTLALSGNYALTYVGADLTITARAIAVTADAKSKTYGDADPALSYAISSGTLAFGDAFAGGLSRVAGENVGSYAIQQGSLSLSGNYALTFTGASLTIVQKAATVTAGGGAKIYGQTDSALSPTIQSGFTAADAATIALSSTRDSGEAVGNYATHPSASGTALGNYAVTYLAGSFSITPATVTVTAGGGTKVYGSADPALNATTQTGLTPADVAAVTLTSSRAPGEPVGNYATTASASGAVLGNYTVTYVAGNFSITRAPLTVKANDVSSPHGNPLPAFTPAYSGLVNGDGPASLGGTPAFSTPATPTSPAGTYPITPSGVTSPNYTITFVAGTLTLTNQAPVAVNDTYTGQWNTPITIAAQGVLVNDSDSNHDPLTAVLVTATTHGTLALNASGGFTYMPAANFSGVDSFTYRANDGALSSNIATATITITTNCPGDGDRDDATHPDRDDCKSGTPIARDDSYSTRQAVTLTVPVKGVLANDGITAVSALLVTAPAHGTVTLNANGSFTYVPVASYYGIDTYTYAARNAAGVAGPVATVTITIRRDLPPDADNDQYSTKKNTTLTVGGAGVLANDSDPENGALTAVLVTGPAHGTLTLNAAGNFVYVPAANFAGTDTFTYNAKDTLGQTDTATVTITVTSHYDGDGDDHDRHRNGHRDGDGCDHDRDTNNSQTASKHHVGDNCDHDRGRNGHYNGDGCEHDRLR